MAEFHSHAGNAPTRMETSGRIARAVILADFAIISKSSSFWVFGSYSYTLFRITDAVYLREAVSGYQHHSKMFGMHGRPTRIYVPRIGPEYPGALPIADMPCGVVRA